MTTISAQLGDALEPLAGAVRGRVITSQDSDWSAKRLGWNVAVPVEPVAVLEAADVSDLQTAVRYAAARGIPVSAQPSGHGVSPELDGTLVLRTAALQQLTIDTDARTATVGAGVKWQQLNEALTGSGLTALPGSSGDVSVVGYTVGGGLSWFGRKYGLACEQMLSVELVNAAGDLITVDQESDPQLWWALRGGGGDFGVITSIRLALQPLPEFYGGRMIWPHEAAGSVLRAFADLTRQAPEELTAWAWLLNLPDLPIVPEPLRGQRVVTLNVTYLGAAAAAESLLAPVLEGLPDPMIDTRGMKQLRELAGIAAEPDDPTPIAEHTAMLSGFDHDTVDELLAGIDPQRPSLLTFVAIRHLGGAFSRPVPSGGAAGVVPQPYTLFAGAIVPAPELITAARAELLQLRASLAAVDTGKAMLNMGPLAAGNLSAETLAELWSVKQRVDPDGIIRSNRPVPKC